jgi:hypothetical protein
MSGEPKLSEALNGSSSDEWVKYLQQVLVYRGYWVAEPDGVFDGQLTTTIIGVQSEAGIEPADGVVGESTWQYLLSDSSSAPDEPSEAAIADGLSVDPSAPVTIPTFQYTFPDVPVAEGVSPTPGLTCTTTLALTGNVKIGFEMCVPGLVAHVNDSTFRQAAEVALGPLNESFTVGGIGSEQPWFEASYGIGFTQESVRFVPPNTMQFRGSMKADYVFETTLGPVQVSGTPGYALDVTCIPNEPPPVEVADERAWYEVYAVELVTAAGVIVLVGGAILLAPETGGLSLGALAAI